MSTLEITIQRKVGTRWPVVVEWTYPEGLPVREAGTLSLDIGALGRLAQPRDYGTSLGRALFRDAVRSVFDRARERGDGCLHLSLVVEEARLRELRWERLCGPNVDGSWDHLAFSQRTPLSVDLPTSISGSFQPIGRASLRVLVVVASPDGLGQFRLHPFDPEEAARVATASLPPGSFDLLGNVEAAIGPATLDALASHLTTSRFSVLHMVAHGQYLAGSGETVVYLPDDQGRATPVTATKLVERLRLVSGPPYLTFLATCESAVPEAERVLGGLAQRMVRELGVPAVIAMTDQISLGTASLMIPAFYRRLLEHGHPDLALAEAHVGLSPAKRLDLAVPALFTRLGGRPLLTDDPHREPSPEEVRRALQRIHGLLSTRAPVLVPSFELASATVGRLVGADAGALTDVARAEFRDARTEVEAITAEALDVSFESLALGVDPPPYDDACPFPGLYPFKGDDARFYFGREQLVGELRARIAEADFLAVVGPSGSGKSSLVMAGLVPRLVEAQPGLRVVSMTPGRDPSASLRAALTGDLGPDILIVDQFEEVFTLAPRSRRQPFVDRLLGQLTRRKVVLTLRADFVGECVQLSKPELREHLQARQELVGPMTPAELRYAMESQAARVGLRFEAGLSATILDDVEGEPGAMPLLQHALRQLWQRRHGRWLSSAEYRSEAIGGIKGAIARTAEKLYGDLEGREREDMRDVFLRLTRVGGEPRGDGTPRETRARVAFEDLLHAAGDADSTSALVEKLVQARLVVTSRSADEGGQEIEVAHEALIRHWPRLQEWIDEDRAALRLRASIAQAADEWRTTPDTSYLTFRGARLQEAERLAANPRFSLNRAEAAFVAACVELRDHEEAEREARRRQELEAARATAASEKARRKAEHAARRELELRLTESELRETSARVLQLLPVRPVQALELAVAAVGRSLARLPRVQAPVQASLREALLGAPERQLIEGPSSAVRAVAFSPTAPIVAGGGDDRIIRLWTDAGVPAGPDLCGHGDAVTALAFVPDGSVLVSASDDGSVLAWDLRPGSEAAPRRLGGHSDAVTALAVSPDGMTVASGSDDGTIRCWPIDGSPPSAEPLATRKGFVSCLAFHPAGRMIACGGEDGVVRLAGLDGVETVAAAHDGFVGSVAFSPDGRWIASGGEDGVLCVWDVAAGRSRAAVAAHQGFVNAVAFLADGQTVVTAGEDGKVRLWDDRGRSICPSLVGHRLAATCLSVSPSGDRIASGGVDRSVRIWDRHVPRYAWLAARGPAPGGGVERIDPWDADGDQVRPAWVGHGTFVTAVAFSPDGSLVASGSGDRTVRLWSLAGDPVPGPFQGHGLEVYAVAFTPDGRIVSAGGDSVLRMWDRQGRQLGHAWSGHRALVTSLAVRVDGAQIVSGSNDGTIRLWHPDGGPASSGIPANGEYVSAVAFSPDGETIASGGADRTVRLWDASGRPAADPFVAHGDYVSALCFSLDGQLIATGGAANDATVRVWDRRGTQAAKPFEGHEARIRSVAFHPDGTLIVSASEDGSVRLWDLDGNELGRPLRAMHGALLSGALSPDGRLIVTGGSDGAVRVWQGGNWLDWVMDACQRLQSHAAHAPDASSGGSGDACREVDRLVRRRVGRGAAG